MARDWIQMRVWLKKDPKVIQMADYLARQRDFMNWLTDPVQQSCKDTAYEHVTRNVTVALCVTALSVTWGTAREQGHRVDDDLILDTCDLETISAIADLPSFGDAMGFVGWVIENQNNSVTFPKFFREQESPHERHRSANAERQARLRERRRNESNVTSGVTRNVTVTHREEESREEESREEERTEEGGIETDILRQPVADGATSTPTSKNGYCPAFLEWWDNYPRKQGKQAAFIAWKKAGKRVKEDRGIASPEAATYMLERVRAYATSKAGCDLQFIPHPATWLNQARYDDDPTVWEREKTIGDGRARNQGTLEHVLSFYDEGNENGDGTTA